MNRAYLSQFETGRRLLDDEQLRKLRAYYEELGHVFSGVEKPESFPEETPDGWHAGDPEDDDFEGRPARVMDGFVVPAGVLEDDADTLLTEYATNTRRLRELANQRLERGFFGGVSDESRRQAQEVLRLMARTCVLIQALQGQEAAAPSSTASEETIGNLVAMELAGHSELMADEW